MYFKAKHQSYAFGGYFIFNVMFTVSECYIFEAHYTSLKTEKLKKKVLNCQPGFSYIPFKRRGPPLRRSVDPCISTHARIRCRGFLPLFLLQENIGTFAQAQLGPCVSLRCRVLGRRHQFSLAVRVKWALEDDFASTFPNHEEVGAEAEKYQDSHQIVYQGIILKPSPYSAQQLAVRDAPQLLFQPTVPQGTAGKS